MSASPPNLELFWWTIKSYLDARDEAQKKVEAAFRVPDPSQCLYYRQAIEDLVRLESQLDGICLSILTETGGHLLTRQQLRQWVSDKLRWVKEQEK